MQYHFLSKNSVPEEIEQVLEIVGTRWLKKDFYYSIIYYREKWEIT